MSRTTLVFRLVVLAVSMSSTIAVAAPAQRTFVACDGADANPCSRTQPCRSFGGAIGQTAAGGEIVVLDSAGYGPVSIAKPIAIVAPDGVYGGVTVTSGVGISIDTPGAGDVVVLRGLTLTGLGGTHGVRVVNVGTLHATNLEIANFTQRGLDFAAAGRLVVADSVFRGNGETGLHVEPATGTAYAGITRSRFERNSANGLVLAGQTRGSVSDSTADHNTNVGFLVDHDSDAVISDCRAVGAPLPIMVRGAATRARISRCSAIPSTGGSFSQAFTSTGGAKATIVDSVGSGAYGGFVVEVGSMMTLERCTASDSYGGMVVTIGGGGGGAGVLRVSASTVVGNINGFGIVPGAGTIETRQNNTMADNTSNYNGTVLAITPY